MATINTSTTISTTTNTTTPPNCCSQRGHDTMRPASSNQDPAGPRGTQRYKLRGCGHWPHDFKWIAFSMDEPYYLTFRDFPRLRNDLFLDLRFSESKLRKMNQISCTTALIRGSLIDIKRLCKYTIFPRPLPPTVYQLTDTALMLSNISDVTITCHNETV